MPDKILIVDVDIETLRLVGVMLQRQGFEIAAANTGVQALSKAAQEHPDLILLEVILDDMDGYEVTRLLRKDPQTRSTPILMFTARSQLDAKMQGYEAGVDDYLTKPVHPVELVARIKALLARNRGREAGIAEDRGYILGVAAPKGGMGVSSLVLNLAIGLYRIDNLSPIAAELRPGNGSWAQDLGINNTNGLSNLLRLKPAEITSEAVEKQLVSSDYGVRLLLSSNSLSDLQTISANAQFEILIHQLSTLSPICLLDIGTPYLPGFDRICTHLKEMILITEPYPGTVLQTKHLIDELNDRGFGRGRLLTVVMINRLRADVRLSISQVQERLGVPVQVIFPPAPEQTYRTGTHKFPLIELQPQSLFSQQFYQLAEIIQKRVKI